MTTITSSTIDEAYAKIVKILLRQKSESGCREITNCNILISNPTLSRVKFPFREISKKYCDEELKWYWSGDNSVDNIGKHAKMWYMLSDDNKTNNSAYGYILQKKHNKNQIEEVISLLHFDKMSRRAVLPLIDPTLDKQNTKDLQCTLCLQFLLRDDKLNMTVYMRSNDIYFGLPYDYIYFISIQEYVAKRLSVQVGQYVHHATSLHMYDKDVQKFIDAKFNTAEYSFDINKIIGEHYEK